MSKLNLEILEGLKALDTPISDNNNNGRFNTYCS